MASPIALATRQAEAEAGSPEELDFLASVEIVVAARCDAFLMQNWAHVVTGQPGLLQHDAARDRPSKAQKVEPMVASK